MRNELIQYSDYKSLSQIRARKEVLLEEIQKEDKKIKELWESLFYHEDLLSASPTKRISGLLNTGASIIDGLILGWKLYRKFHGYSFFRGRR
jgi:hypothetical protein